MKVCYECGEKVALSRNVAVEHFSRGIRTYICTSCRQETIQSRIEATRRALGLPPTQAHPGS